MGAKRGGGRPAYILGGRPKPESTDSLVQRLRSHAARATIKYKKENRMHNEQRPQGAGAGYPSRGVHLQIGYLG